ncbi:hypothetical protein Ato02nite_024110 [Paractinoplanes toevensis]|uniref:Uncharacterized protein n=1 Tax=Paractinoplanes toevensis TaxID=571911 RepID=A0A919W4X6_9ACTN|nr:hypothetical protein Ato02nite_024110 [Actinoplanes toevensis]
MKSMNGLWLISDPAYRNGHHFAAIVPGDDRVSAAAMEDRKREGYFQGSSQSSSGRFG